MNIYSLDKCSCRGVFSPSPQLLLQLSPNRAQHPQPAPFTSPLPTLLPCHSPLISQDPPAFLLSSPFVLHQQHPEGPSGNPDLAARPHLGPSGAPVFLLHAAQPQHWVLPTVWSPCFLRQHAGWGILAHQLGLGSPWKLLPLPSTWSTHLVQGSRGPLFFPAQVSLMALHTSEVGPCTCPKGEGPGLTPPLWKKWRKQSCEQGQGLAADPALCWPGLGHMCVLHCQWPGRR